jgi:adenylosuccinate synthase
MDYLAITRLDILDKMDTIKMCVGYEIDGKPIANIPADLKILGQSKTCVRGTFPGWKQDISGIKNYAASSCRSQKICGKTQRGSGSADRNSVCGTQQGTNYCVKRAILKIF